jgi:hypothetical protein
MTWVLAETGVGAQDPVDAVPPVAEPPRHKPPRADSPKEQADRHKMENSQAGWCGLEDPGWVRSSSLGDREAVLGGIADAVMANYGMGGAGQSSDVVDASWLKDQIDAYNLKTLDQDVRSELRDRFVAAGIKVTER